MSEEQKEPEQLDTGEEEENTDHGGLQLGADQKDPEGPEAQKDLAEQATLQAAKKQLAEAWEALEIQRTAFTERQGQLTMEVEQLDQREASQQSRGVNLEKEKAQQQDQQDFLLNRAQYL